MKKALMLIVVAMLFVAAVSCQVRHESPVTVQWDAPASGFFTYYEVAVEPMQGGEEVEVGSIDIAEHVIDLEVLDLYGVYVVIVRSVAFTEPDIYDYSEGARSDNPDDVISVDGVAQTFYVYRARRAGKPTMIRVP